MTDTGQPNGAAAADLLARHNKKKQKKVSNPEEPFDFIFSKNLALRPITDKKTRDLDHRGLMEVSQGHGRPGQEQVSHHRCSIHLCYLRCAIYPGH
jgi:hypothetical protein